MFQLKHQYLLTLNSNLNFTKYKLSDKTYGVDSSNSLSCLSCEDFHGFESIKTENALKDLTGTTFPIFNILLKLMPPSKRFSITKVNELLLFLMKLKLGITICNVWYTPYNSYKNIF